MSNRLTSRRVSRLSSRVRARLVGFEKHPDWLKGADSTSVAAHARIASGGRVRGAANGAPFSSGASCENRSPVFALLSTADWDCARGHSSGVRGHARGQFFTSWEHSTGVAEPPDFHDATDHNVVDGKIANIDPIVNIPSGRIQTCRPASTISCSPEKTASCDMRV